MLQFKDFSERLSNVRKSLGPELIIKYWWLWALILITIFALWTRSIPAKYGELQALDPFYAYRMDVYMLEHNLLLPERDHMRYWPDGVPLGQYGQIMSFYTPVIFYLVLSFVGISMPFLNFAILYPAIMGALSVFIIFWIAKELFKDNKAALFSAMFMATIPAYISRTSAGFFDKEATGGPFILLAIYFFIRSYNKNSWKWGLLGSLGLAMSLNSWGGSSLLLFILPAFFFVKMLLNQYSDRMLVTSLSFFPLGILITQIIGGFSNVGVKELFPMFVIVLITARFAAEKFNLVKKDQLRYLPLGMTILLIVAFLIGSMFSDYLWKQLSSLINMVNLGRGVIAQTVAEQMPGNWNSIVGRFTVSFSRSIIPLPEPFTTLFSPWFLMIAGIFVAAFNIYSKGNWMLLFPILWLLMSVQTVFYMIRLVILLAPPAALMSGFLLAEVINRFSRTSYMQKKEGINKINVVSVIVLVMISFLIVSNLATAYVFNSSIGPSFNQYWRESMDFLSEKTPVNASVLSWWDFGYWFQTRGNRPSTADGGNINGTVDVQIAEWFTSDPQNWNDYRWWLRGKDVSYILMDYTLPGKYGAISKIASNGKSVIGMLQFSQTGVFPQTNKTIVEFKAGQYTIWIPVGSDGNIVGSPQFMISRGEQYMGRTYINDICTTNGIIRFESPENADTMPGCITMTAYGLFFVPVEAEFTIFTSLMFMDGYGIPDVEKVFDNSLIKIYKLEINESA